MSVTAKKRLPKFLYLLPFNDGEHFKIGISSQGFNRINKHNLTYGIKFSKSLIVLAKKEKTIELLEKNLLNIYDRLVLKFKGKDGWKEVRKMDFFKESIQEINSSNRDLYISMKPLKNYIKSQPQKSIPIKSKEQISYEEIDKRLKGLQFSFITDRKGQLSRVYYDMYGDLVCSFEKTIKLEDQLSNDLLRRNFRGVPRIKSLTERYSKDQCWLKLTYEPTQESINHLANLLDVDLRFLDKKEGIKKAHAKVEKWKSEKRTQFSNEPFINLYGIDGNEFQPTSIYELFKNIDYVDISNSSFLVLIYKNRAIRKIHIDKYISDHDILERDGQCMKYGFGESTKIDVSVLKIEELSFLIFAIHFFKLRVWNHDFFEGLSDAFIKEFVCIGWQQGGWIDGWTL